MNKPKVVKDYNKLNRETLSKIKLNYPFGFASKLITFTDPKGKIVSALPFETEDRHYLIRMTEFEAKKIMQDDDDFTEDGKLKEEVKQKLQNQLNVDESEMSKVKSEMKKDVSPEEE